MFNKSVNNIRLMLLIIPAGFFIFLSTACFNNERVDTKSNDIKPAAGDKMKISWQQPVKVKDETVIQGFVKSGFGNFEFMWVINPEGMSKLVTRKFSGSAELPLKEKKILPLVLPDGSTILFQEWPPLLNEKRPYSMRVIATVPTSELFSVLPGVKLPPSCIISKIPEQIKWDKVFDKNGIKYLQGNTKGSSGPVNLLFEKKGSGNPELVLVESQGNGELSSKESKLLPWMDETTGLTYICQERFLHLNQGNSPYLWCLATVKTVELLSGYNLINSAVSEKK